MMKISTAFLALPMFLLAAPVNAQVGVVAGFVSSNLSIDDFDDTESRTGFAVGLTMSRWMGPSLSFNPEVLYITKGAAFEDEEEKLAYLEVPLMFRYNIMTSGGEFRPFITAGPTIGYLLSCDFTDEGESFDCGDGHKKLDIGIGLGAGFNVSRFSLSARYELGMSNIADVPDEVDVSEKNSALMLIGSMSF